MIVIIFSLLLGIVSVAIVLAWMRSGDGFIDGPTVLFSVLVGLWFAGAGIAISLIVEYNIRFI